MCWDVHVTHYSDHMHNTNLNLSLTNTFFLAIHHFTKAICVFTCQQTKCMSSDMYSLMNLIYPLPISTRMPLRRHSLYLLTLPLLLLFYLSLSNSSPNQPQFLSNSDTLPATSNTHSMTIRTKTQSLRPKKFPDHQVYITTVPAETLSDPSSYTQAVKHQHWRSTMASELDVLTKNIT
jgi:hypothetical protein